MLPIPSWRPPQRWRYDPAESRRDLRLDLLRGLCLLKMIFNHLWHTPLHAIQSWIGYISAAEGFFFISGAVVGMVHGRRMHTQGLGPTSRAVVTRGLHLYVANLALVILYVALESSRLLRFRFLWHPGFEWPVVFAFNHPYFLQVLPRYAAYLVVTPAALWCLKTGRTRWLLAASSGLYLLNWALGGRYRLPFIEAGELGGFLLIVWQLLFFFGMALGYHRQRVGRWWRALPTWARAGVPAVGYLGFVLLERAVSTGRVHLPPALVADLFGRGHLGPGRLVNLAVAFLFFFLVTDAFWQPLKRFLGAVLMPFGQSSLYTFLIHILINGLTLVVVPHLPFTLQGHAWRLVVADLLLLALHWLMVRRQLLSAIIPR